MKTFRRVACFFMGHYWDDFEWVNATYTKDLAISPKAGASCSYCGSINR